MVRSPELTRALKLAHEAFVATGMVNPDLAGVVRPEILKSWRRSTISGAHPSLPTLVTESGVDLQSRIQAAARPVFGRLADQLHGLRVSMFLMDERGVILRRWVEDPQLRQELDRICSDIGVRCAEEFIGTNSSGIAIEEGRPAMVAGPEHFAEVLHDFACASALIRHPRTRRLQGAISLTCLYRDVNDLLLPMAAQAAAEIEERLLDDLSADERVLMKNFVTATSRHAGGVVVLNERMVIANPAAARLLEGTDHALLWEHAARAIGGRTEHTSTLSLSSAVVETSCRAITDGGDTLGALIEIANRTRGRRTGASPKSEERRLLGLVGRSNAWRRVEQEALAAVHSGLPVLLRGEPGVGKAAVVEAMYAEELVSGMLHRVDAALASVDGPTAWLRTVREQLDRPGTVVLTHVDLLDATVLQSLCSLIDAAPVVPRLVATLTCREDERVRAAARFVDRFNFVIDIPALRTRADDVPDLVDVFTRRHADDASRTRWLPDVVQALTRLEWDGNARELGAVVRRTLVRRPSGDIGLDDLPEDVRARTHRTTLTHMERLEASAIAAALEAAGGNKLEAANALGISRSTLYRKLRHYGIELDVMSY